MKPKMTKCRKKCTFTGQIPSGKVSPEPKTDQFFYTFHLGTVPLSLLWLVLFSDFHTFVSVGINCE